LNKDVDASIVEFMILLPMGRRTGVSRYSYISKRSSGGRRRRPDIPAFARVVSDCNIAK
jgi:hypothetical protein